MARIKSHYIIYILLLLSVQSGLQQLGAQGLPINPPDEDPQRNVLIEPFKIVDNINYFF